MEPRNERITPMPIEQEMKTSFLDYSMSVIVSRALPDVRDGLKPVHRRILYVMHEAGLRYNASFRKCATVVGDALGKYHPHGDQSVYDAMVRMAQEWNMRYPLVAGQGNFGSVDGDSAAAYRYTEAKMAAISNEMLADIEKDTVDMRDNYDGRLQEPVVLPSAIPNLLVNGSYGIAVGMATSCPPHNLSEVSDAIIHMIDFPEATTRDLMRYVKGPDFPTGAIICGTSGLLETYQTGRGRVTVRARTFIEKTKSTDKDAIIVTELPYQVNKARLIENIARLVQEKTIEGITDLRDESDKDGMRIVIEVRKGEEPEVILNNLFKHTQLQDNSSIIMLALVNNAPKVLSLAEMIRYFIKHRAEIVERRTRYDLKKAEDRAHIVEGLLKAIDHIDEVVHTIRTSPDVDVARANLMAKFAFTEIQAQAILAMQLRRLTGLDRDELQKEYADLIKLIEMLRHILSSEKTILAEVRKETEAIRAKYGDARRTEILGDLGEFRIEDLIADEPMVVTISKDGYIKRLPLATYRKQGRGGQGVAGGSTNEDFVKDLFVASAHQYLLFFTTRGRCYWRKVHELPKASRTAKGRYISNFLALDKESNESVTTCLPVRDLDNKDAIEGMMVFMVTELGTVKKTPLKDFSNPRTAGIIAIDLEEHDTLIDVQLTTGNDNILIATRNGLAIRFPEKDVRAMGRQAHGVKGIDLDNEDRVIGVSLAKDDMTVLSVCENGRGKRTEVGEYRVQHRGGKGIINIKTQVNGPVIGMLTVDDLDEIVVVRMDGKLIRVPVADMRAIGRNTQGVWIMKTTDDAKIVAIARAVGASKEDAMTSSVEVDETTTSTDDETPDDTD